MKRQSKVDNKWSANLSYVIGVIATDGNLSPNGRNINVTSKDEEMILNIKSCLNLNNKIGKKASGTNPQKSYYVIQFGDINFYEFLNKIGLTKNKSKSIGKLKIHKKFFMDFLRGCFDGDENFSVSLHPESRLPQLRIRLCSASPLFVHWIKREINSQLNIKSGWIHSDNKSMHTLSYGKSDSIKILKKMYYNGVRYYLDRKYQTIKSFIM